MHDSFIRSVLSDKSVAADYFQQYLPMAISQVLDFATLAQLPDTYLSEELQKTMSDIVYQCKTKDGSKEIKVSLLVEHKSYPDKNTPIQIGSYIFSALQKQIANKEKLSLVIPVLLYHGKEKWQYQTLAHLFENLEQGWEKYLPDFSYIYNNLGDISDTEVEAISNKFLAASLLTLKHSFEKEWLEQNAVRLLLFIGGASGGLQKSFGIYLFSRSEMKAEAITKLIDTLPLHLKNTVMSTADYFIEKGIEKGVEKGRIETEEKKNQQFVESLLSAGKFTIAEVANYANVSEAFVQQVIGTMS